MHQLRSTLREGEGCATYSPLSTKERCRRGKEDRRAKETSGPSLAGLTIARSERRTTNQRRGERHREVVERTTIVFRGKKSLVRVVNISESGVMIESSIMPRIGETIRIHFEGFERLTGVVRWVKQGRIGLDVGEGNIEIHRG
jgi:PilZ domain